MDKKRKSPRKPPEYWASLNWSRTNRQLVEETGNLYAIIALNRKKYAPVEFKNVRPLKIKKLLVSKIEELHLKPEEMTTFELAQALGVGYFTIARYKLNKMCKKLIRGVKIKYNFDGVDWQEQDILIARKLGCSRELVRKKRIKLQKEKPTAYHKRTDSAAVRAKNMNIDVTNLTAKELSNILGIGVPRVYSLFQKKFKHNMPHKYDWSKITDEDLRIKSDKEIAALVGSPVIAVTQRRIYKGIKRRDKRYDWSIFKKDVKVLPSYAEIAKKVGCSVYSVAYHIKKHKAAAAAAAAAQ